MKVFVKKWNRLKLVAKTKPERDLLKHFSKKEPYICGFTVERNLSSKQETEVTLTIGFRTLAKPKEGNKGLRVLH